jgi:peptide chain release factor subunit 1
MSVVEAARRLVEERPGSPVISLYLDLDPERFATAPARASQIRSLIDEGEREVQHQGSLGHAERAQLREDLRRLDDYLHSRQPPYQGARGLAVFCCGSEDLFEVVQLARPTEGQIVIERTPYVEPLIRSADERRWCVALVSRRSARLFVGPADRVSELRRVEDDTHGQHDQGGLSQARYERSVEKEADDHLRRVAELLYRRWRRERFQCLALGGPTEVVPRLEGLLHDELRSRLTSGRVEVDVESANEDHVREALAPLVEDDERSRERSALDQLAAGVGAGGRGAGGPEAVVEALNERRVGTLLLEDGFDRRGSRCPACGTLSLESGGTCPADGTELEEVEHLREAAVELALEQGAQVLAVRWYPDLGPFEGIGAVLRF